MALQRVVLCVSVVLVLCVSAGAVAHVALPAPPQHASAAAYVVIPCGGVFSVITQSVREITLQCAAGKAIEFKTLVEDQVWEIGANHVIDSLPAGNHSVDIYPFYFSQRGRYAVEGSIASPQLGNTRDYVVYYPPSYAENTLKRYPLLVMHDGQNLFNDSTSFLGVAWHCQDTVDELVNEGAMQEIVIVGLYNTLDRMNEYTYSYDPSEQVGGKGDLYLDFIEQQVLPLVEKTLRVDSTGVGIMGSSLGGLISCYAGYTRPSVYSIAGCMSSSFWWNSEDFLGTVVKQHPTPAPTGLHVYLDSGNTGPGNDSVTQTIDVRDFLTSPAGGFVLNSDVFYFLDDGGQHNEIYWGRRFHVPMADLYPVTSLVVD